MNKYYLLCFLLGSVGGDPSLRAQTGTPAQRKPPASSQREPGLYMRFETSMGAINCKLFEKEAPVTVRTIVGLAVGCGSEDEADGPRETVFRRPHFSSRDTEFHDPRGRSPGNGPGRP